MRVLGAQRVLEGDQQSLSYRKGPGLARRPGGLGDGGWGGLTQCRPRSRVLCALAPRSLCTAVPGPAGPAAGCHRPRPQRGSSRKVVLAVPISGAQPVGGSARPELTQNPQGKRSGCLLPLRDADGPAPPPRSPRRSAAARWAAF